MDINGLAATAEEIRKLQRIIDGQLALAGKSGRLPPHAQVSDKNFVFGEDTGGSPAVWISVFTKSDSRPSDDDVAHLADLLDGIVVEVLKSDVRHWPYFRFHADQRSHAAA